MLVRYHTRAGGVTYRADFDLAVDNDGSFLDSVQSENGCDMLVYSQVPDAKYKPV
jgi:hypothetical protein